MKRRPTVMVIPESSYCFNIVSICAFWASRYSCSVYSCVLTKDDETPTYGEISEGSILNNGEKFADVAEYVAAQKDQIDALLKQMEGSGMTMQIYGEENTLVYRYIYEEAVEVSDEYQNTTGKFHSLPAF